MSSFFKDLREFLWLYRQGFRPTEYLRNSDRISLHACGWRANGSGRMKTARDAVAYLEGSMPEQWRQVYCGLTPFLVSDRGNVRLIDGSEPRMMLANGRYQIAYKPEEQHPSRRGRRGGMAHKKRVYRSVLVAMAFLDFKKGDAEHEVHHVNGYRTDDRLVNLMVLTHDEHTRIHNMGPCGLTAPLDDAVRDAGLLAEVKPMGTMKLRRIKKKALKRALETPEAAKKAIADDNANNSEALDAPEISGDESQKPNRAEIIPAEAPAGTFTCNPLPVLDETGVFVTPEAPEILAIKRAEEAQHEAEKRAAEEKAAAEEAELAAIPARGSHKAEEKSSLQAAAEEGMAEVAEKIDAACVRSGARAQEMINGEGPTKAAKRRASKKRAEARRAEEKAARREAQKQIARKESQAESDIPDEASAEAERVSEYPQDAFIAAEGEAVIEEGTAAEGESAIDETAAEAGETAIDEVAVAEGKAAISEAFIVEVLTEAEVSEQNELSGQGVPSCQNVPSEQGVSVEQRTPSDEVAPEKQASPSQQAPLSRQAFPSKGADSSKKAAVSKRPIPSDQADSSEQATSSRRTSSSKQSSSSSQSDQEPVKCSQHLTGSEEADSSKGDASSKQPNPSEQVDSSKRASSSKQSDQKSVKRREHLTDSKRDTAEADWAAAREVLARETRAYLKAARKLSRKDDAGSKQFASAAKPVYKALKPFLTCSDEVCAFDACLVCIRLIAQDAQTRAQHGQPELPQTTHSLLGNFQKLMKASVRKLIRADEIVAACTEELLREEAAKPVYKSLPNSPLKQCLDIIGSKKPKEAAEPDEAPRAKPEENTATEGKASEGKRRRRRRRKKEHAENKGPEKQNRSAESEEETKAEAAQ
ncbi:HNH endonuclease [uncultured Slackia sp.]|uniref:HNH endonuclease n=1 Tax=uncultured Slackia sp. TaxID=665903 RepID=UPI002674C01F|nr:HNH endonuclease [uncultured Slackia sp.]